LKWLEVNLGIKRDLSAMHTVLLEFVVPLLEDVRSRIESWHFLWESKPWPDVKGNGITLRLRFYGESNTIDQIKEEIEKKLIALEKEKHELYRGHCFGKHGECDKDYEGEADDWGTEAWELGTKFLNLGSEVSLKLIKNQQKIGSSKEYRRPIEFYVDRYVHCFLNNIFDQSEEIDFYLKEAIGRLYYAHTGRSLEPKTLEIFISKIKTLILKQNARA
jgi:hypothetical protein